MRLILFFVAALAMLCAGCSRSDELDNRLSLVERLLESSPDSARTVLNSAFDEMLEGNCGQQALYSLLERWLAGGHQPVTDPELLTEMAICLDYYENLDVDDVSHRMQARYLSAIDKFAQGRLMEARLLSEAALQDAEQLGDELYIGRLKSYINENWDDNEPYLIGHCEVENRLRRELSSANDSLNLFMAVGLVMMLVVAAIFYLYCNRHRKLMAKARRTIRTQKDMLTEKMVSDKCSQDMLHELLMENYSSMDSLCADYYASGHSKPSTDRYVEVETFVRGCREDGELLERLEAHVNYYQRNLMTDFRARLPQLKETDYRLFLFTVLGFSIVTISLLLDEKKLDAVYNRKARLKRKISELDSRTAQKFMSYM